MGRDFLGMLETFVSSDTQSIHAGDEWLVSVRKALEQCAMLVVLCSPDSVHRPWINFEAGAAWMRDIPIVPVCHSGLHVRDLLVPLSLRQAIALDNAKGLEQLYSTAAKIVGCRVPGRDFSALARDLAGGLPIKVLRSSPQIVDSERALRDRLLEALSHPDVTWRSLHALASELLTTEERVSDLLLTDRTVRFSTGKSGQAIVGLKSRVGETRKISKRTQTTA